jgi:tetratricopeptide (TPR) repeat protein
MALKLNFSGDFFAAIQSLDETGTGGAHARQLTFVLLGAALPADLEQAASRPLFKTWPQLNLSDFDQQEVRPLQQGLQPVFSDQAQAIFARILYWTQGHPYLTQKLAQSGAETGSRGAPIEENRIEKFVDGLVKKEFSASTVRREPHFQSIREHLQRSPQQRRLLTLYRQVYAGKKVREDQQSSDQARLKLIGLVRAEEGQLRLRNQIYRQAFPPNSIQEKKSISWTPYLVKAGLALAALAILFLLGLTGYNLYQQRLGTLAIQAQDLAATFEETTDPDTRLVNLAALFRLGNQQDEAQRLFYALKPADQLALFEATNPEQRGADMITTIKGIYTSSNLENNEQNNALLGAMAQPLKQLEHTEHPGVIDLELEITNWLRGRTLYQEGQHRQAIGAYNVALSLNSDNPNLYFDRGLAMAALGDGPQALADLTTALNLDNRRQAQIQQLLTNDPQLYDALWAGAGEYQALAMLVPTPTVTPKPTQTPLPTPTPSPTQTPQRILPTPTPSPSPTPTSPTVPVLLFPPATPTPLPAATASIATGVFTLIAPSAAGDPTFGLTNFEWEWSGPVPSGYGFEVRVWREGSVPLGVHNAVLDNQNGNVQHLGGNKYRLNTNITDAAGIRGQSGDYLWTVALVQVSPDYADLGQQAAPGHLRFAAPRSGGGGGGEDDDKGGGGGGGAVGID